MQRKFSHAFHVPGTLSANLAIVFTVPSGCKLVHVSAVGSNANDATLSIGTTSAATAYTTAFAIGDSSVPVQKEALTDFDGTVALNQYPAIADGTVMKLTVDYDGASGTAADDLTIVLTFVEGGV